MDGWICIRSFGMIHSSDQAHEKTHAFAEHLQTSAGARRGKLLLPALTASLYAELREPLLKGSGPACMERIIQFVHPPP